MEVQEDYRELLKSLNDREVEFIVVGAHALAAPRSRSRSAGSTCGSSGWTGTGSRSGAGPSVGLTVTGVIPYSRPPTGATSSPGIQLPSAQVPGMCT